MNFELITGIINIISISIIVILMIYYSLAYKRTDLQMERIKTTRKKPN